MLGRRTRDERRVQREPGDARVASDGSLIGVGSGSGQRRNDDAAAVLIVVDRGRDWGTPPPPKEGHEAAFSKSTCGAPRRTIEPGGGVRGVGGLLREALPTYNVVYHNVTDERDNSTHYDGSGS